jgi:hypothetical protein
MVADRFGVSWMIVVRLDDVPVKPWLQTIETTLKSGSKLNPMEL